MKLPVIAVVGAMAAVAGIALAACAKPAEPKEVIGIIGAMDEEVTTLKDAAALSKTTTVAEMEFCEGTLQGKKVVIVKCGM